VARPTVNLDAVAAILDRVLEHPLAAVAAELLPQTHGAVRMARGHLPEIASGLEARAVDTVKSEARALEAELVGGLTRWMQETLRKGRGEAAPKRLRARPNGRPRKAAKKGKKR
jgi:hypothetical protein